LVGKLPAGIATHQLVHPSGALYNSNNRIVMSQAIETNDTKKGLPFKDGTVIVKYMPKIRKVQWLISKFMQHSVLNNQKIEKLRKECICSNFFLACQHIIICTHFIKCRDTRCNFHNYSGVCNNYEFAIARKKRISFISHI